MAFTITTGYYLMAGISLSAEHSLACFLLNVSDGGKKQLNKWSQITNIYGTDFHIS